jgi:hypothetical protein
MLAAGLVALVGSVALGSVTWVVSDSLVALVGTASIGVMTLAMLLPWKQRHNPDGEDPVLYRGDRPVLRTAHRDQINPVFTDSAGVTLNPASLTFARMGWVVPFVVGLFVGLVPILCLLGAESATVATILAIVVGWVGFGVLWMRHVRREIEAGELVSRSVP